jgi:hypothetical protein
MLSRIFHRVVSHDTEIRALRILKEFLDSILGKMETTLEQDEIALNLLENMRLMSTKKGLQSIYICITALLLPFSGTVN